MAKTVADVLVGVLEQIGVKHIFGLIPNVPHVDLDTIGHFALAKIKEAVLAVTGA